MMQKNRKAQGALEYLLMIGAAILVVAIVIIGISGIITSTNDQNTSSEYNNQLQGLKGLLNLSEDPKQNEPNLFLNLDKIEIKIKEIEIL